MKKTILVLILFAPLLIQAQTTEQNDKEAILAVMDMQIEAWNNYDLEGFMQGYWKSDSLKFYGSNGVT